MMTRFDVRDLAVPVIVAPMAGGPSTPELAAAGTNAGGLGFVAAGYLTAEVLAERIAAARRLTSGPLGVNLFVPQPSAGTPAAIERYAAALADEAQRYGARLGEPRYDDDQWAAKLDVVLDVRPEVVSFTFGLPTAAECERLRAAGITTVGTVTTLAEAEMAVGCGVDAVAAQGPSAGGHRGTFDPAAHPAADPLEQLLPTWRSSACRSSRRAGSLTADDVGRVCGPVRWPRSSGRRSCSPTKRAAARCIAPHCRIPVHRNRRHQGFSGRYARGLRNRFIDEHEADAPFGYPEIHYLTSPLRAASVRAGDPHAINVWAGTGFRKAKAASVADIMKDLM